MISKGYVSFEREFLVELFPTDIVKWSSSRVVKWLLLFKQADFARKLDSRR